MAPQAVTKLPHFDITGVATPPSVTWPLAELGAPNWRHCFQISHFRSRLIHYIHQQGKKQIYQQAHIRITEGSSPHGYGFSNDCTIIFFLGYVRFV